MIVPAAVRCRYSLKEFVRSKAMRASSFIFLLFVLAGLILAAPTEISAGFGFLLVLTLSWFVFIPIGMVLQTLGLPSDHQTIFLVMRSLYALLALYSLYNACVAWWRRTTDDAFLATFCAIVIFSLPLIGWRAVGALDRAWPH